MIFLITGGSGYIGENLANYLRSICKDNKVLISDFHLGDFPLAQNLRDSHFKDIDVVIHLAATSGIQSCERDPRTSFTNNVITAFNVFSRARDNDVPVIFTSSQAAKDPHSSEYAYQKWSAEHIANTINQDGGQIYILRLANVYGGYKYLEKKTTVMKQFISQYELGRDITIHGSGEQIRDFIHVEDVCEAITEIIDYTKYDSYPFKNGDVIDIGTGIGTSILSLANAFEGGTIYHEEARGVGVDSNIANIEEIKKLGFRPKHNVIEYVKNKEWRKEVVKGIFEDNM